MDPCIVIADSIDVASFFYLMIWVDVRMMLLTGGMCGACGRMAVYSQQPTMCWAPGCHGVYPQWWRPKQTAGKLSHAPCEALPPYS